MACSSEAILALEETPCDVSTRRLAPCCASQRAVSRPRPAVPPVTMWQPSVAGVNVCGVMRTTILPTFRPPCSVRKASSN
eukprot:7388061-Prymnesium_polylepis.1